MQQQLARLVLAALLALTGGASVAVAGARPVDFAPPGAVHDPKARYRLPFRLDVPRVCSQAVGGERTHSNVGDYHAFDFVLPIGAPVLAARAGRVARLRDGYTEGAMEERFKGTGNTVWVLHGDGTFAIYTHLSPGLAVKEGQRVSKGTLLGRSGSTGWTNGPHLHFVVRRLTGAGVEESVPIRFGGRKGFVPQALQYYGVLPKPNAEIKLMLGEREVSTGFTKVRPGSTTRLQVLVAQPGKGFVDVSASPTTRILSMTPWSATVAKDGRIRFSPGEGFDDTARDVLAELGLFQATIGVVHGKRGDPVVAVGRAEFEIGQ